MLNIVLFGPPGAGKGTQAVMLSKQFNLKHLSTGEMLREEISKESELGIEAKRHIDMGHLVPDEIVVKMIEGILSENCDCNGFIFDGFPRTVAQAEELDTITSKLGIEISGMLALEVENDELVKRLLHRGKSSGRSDDADVSIIENRINVYNEKTLPLIEFYKAQNKFQSVAGMGSIEDILLRLEKAIAGL